MNQTLNGKKDACEVDPFLETDDICRQRAGRMARINLCPFMDYDDFLQEARIAVWEAWNKTSGNYDEFIHYAYFLVKRRTASPKRWRTSKMQASDIPNIEHHVNEDLVEFRRCHDELKKLPSRAVNSIMSNAGITDLSQKDIAKIHGVSAVRISQIASWGIKKIRQSLQIDTL